MARLKLTLMLLFFPVFSFSEEIDDLEIYTKAIFNLSELNTEETFSITMGNSECISCALRSRLVEKKIVLSDCPEDLAVGHRILLGDIGYEGKDSAIVSVIVGNDGIIFEFHKEKNIWEIIESAPLPIDMDLIEF